MKTLAIATTLAFLLPAPLAFGQTITTEAAVSAGMSTDDVSAGAVQLRAFGELKGGVRFFGEAAWAKTSNTDSDFFASAYPYSDRVQVIEAYGERTFRPGEGLVSIRAGRFRPPFGISSASDHAYTGFLRPPFFRYDENSAVSNNFLEHGADLVVGVPHFTLETALGAPADVGTAVRRSGLDAIVRVQGAVGPFIAGVSHMRTSPLESVEVDQGRADFTGLDLRWMYRGVQVRGEWMTGHPFEGATMKGWYADALIHLVRMGPVTAVARIEQFEQEGGDASESAGAGAAQRQVIGARIRLPGGFSLNVDLMHRMGKIEVAESNPFALDVGITWTVRPHK
jgi:hypothetical protein